MLELTKKRLQAGMWESGPSGKNGLGSSPRIDTGRADRGKPHLRGSGKRRTTADISTTRAHASRRRPAEEVRHPPKESGGGSTEGALRGNGKPQKTGRGSKEGQERLKKAGRRGKEPAGEEKNRLRRMNTKKPAPSSGAGTLLGRSQIRASRHCQPSHARGWQTHA